MARAEEIASDAGYTKLAVISGVGVRNYYRRLGYEVRGEGQFMIKDLKPRGAVTTPAMESNGGSVPAVVGVGGAEAGGGSDSAGGGCVALSALALGVAALVAARWK